MADDEVHVHAVSLNGACVLRIAGELDTTVADAVAGRAHAAVQPVQGPVLVDLSDLTFIDAHGARDLDTLIRSLRRRRPTAVRRCPLRIRRVLNSLGLSLDSPQAGDGTASWPEAGELVDRVRRARACATESRLSAIGTMTRLTDTQIQLASTLERAGLLREQGRKTLASSRAARRHLTLPQRGMTRGGIGL